MSSVAINFTLLICDGVNQTLLQRIRDAGFKKMQFPGRLLRTLTCITDRSFYIRDMYLIQTKPQIMQSWHVCLSECTHCISHIICIECIHDDILRDGIIDDPRGIEKSIRQIFWQ